MPSRPVTPFIPPPPGASPQSSASDGPPPLVPAPGGPVPPWMAAQAPPFAMPGMFHSHSTGHGSGFPFGRPPSARPPSRGDRGGYSADWIGPTGPTGPQSAGPGYPPEWLGPGGWTPAGVPGGLPMQASPWGAATGYSAFQQPLPNMGYVPMGPPMGPPMMGMGMGAPMGMAPPGYGMHAMGVQATPWMGGGYGFTPGPPPHPQLGEENLTRPMVETGGVDTRFMAGKNYGPTLDPLLVTAVRCQPIANPFLSPPPGSVAGDDDSKRTHLIWNMLFESSFAKHSDDASSSRHANRSWSKGRDEPATFPRLTSLKIISHQFPWFVEIVATGMSRRSRHRRSRVVNDEDDEGGNAPYVTCGDLIDQLSEFLLGRAAQAEFSSLDRRRQNMITASYYENRAAGHDVPGGRLGQGLARCDWLGAETMWDGLVVDTPYVRERLSLKLGERGRDLPCVFVLKCARRGGMGVSVSADGDTESRSSD